MKYSDVLLSNHIVMVFKKIVLEAIHWIDHDLKILIHLILEHHDWWQYQGLEERIKVGHETYHISSVLIYFLLAVTRTIQDVLRAGNGRKGQD